MEKKKQKKLEQHNYPVTKLSFKLRDIYRNNVRTMNCAGKTKDISEQRYQNHGNVWHTVHVKAKNISFFLSF